MKKAIKLFIFLFIITVFCIAFSDKVYAAYKPVNCENYTNKDKCEKKSCQWVDEYCEPMSCVDYGEYCTEFGNISVGFDALYASNGESCKTDDNNYCVAAAEVATCTSYSAKNCPDRTKDETAENGDTCTVSEGVCIKDDTDVVISDEKKKKTCMDYGFYNMNCREKDDWGNYCTTDGWDNCVICDMKDEECVPREKITCEDYKTNESLCAGSDELENDCTMIDNYCATADSYGRKVCGDYSYNKCPRKDQLGDVCKPSSLLNACIMVNNISEYNRALTNAHNRGDGDATFGKEINISKADGETTCADVSEFAALWVFLRIITPFLVVIFGALDFYQTIISNDPKKINSLRGKFVRRIIIFILLILTPLIIQFILVNLGTFGSDNLCLFRCIVTNNTSDDVCSTKK